MSIRVLALGISLGSLLGLSACGGDSDSRRIGDRDGGDEPEPTGMMGEADGGADDDAPEPDPGTTDPDDDAGPGGMDEVPVDDDADDDADDDDMPPDGDLEFEASTLEDTPLVVSFADFGVPVVEIEADGITTPPENGTLEFNDDGAIYTPNPDFFGEDVIEYTLPDGSVITVIITVEPVNDPPVAVDDAFAAPSGGTYESDGSVLDNDSDVDSDDLEVSIVSPPAQGTLTLNADGTFTYEHTGDPGTDSFIYEVCDAEGDCAEATVELDVSDANQPPVAEDDEYAVQRGGTLNIAAPGVLVNDSDPDGDALTSSVDTGPSNGALTLNADGSFTYVHDGSAGTSGSFTYEACDPDGACDTATVTLEVTAGTANNAPLAVNDSYTVNEGGTLVGVNVLDNDSDPEGTGLTATLATNPSNGTAQLDPDGSLLYTHDGSETSADSFTYEACDADGACSVATVSIVVLPINDAPVAEDDEVEVDEGGEVTANVLDNDEDPDGDALTATLLTDPDEGSVALNADGSFTYTHDGEESTEDSFTYEACDPSGECDSATVNITIGPVNDPPIAMDDSYSGNQGVLISSGDEPLTANDEDPEGGPLTVNTTPVTPPTQGTLTLNADGSFTYAPATNDPDSFVYEVCDDGGACAQATVTLAFFNSVPVAQPDTASVQESDSVIIPVMSNDSDPGGDPLTLNAITVLPQVGTVQPNPDGTITYTLNCADSGLASDAFRYRICDTEGACTSALVTVALEFFDVVVDDLVGNRLATGVVPAVVTAVMPADVEIDGGRFAIDAAGSFNYLPPVGAREPDSFAVTYEVVNPSPRPQCETEDDIVFNLGPNAVWHVDPNQGSPSVAQAGVVVPAGLPTVSNDGREKFPDGPGDFDSYAFTNLFALAEAETVEAGDIIVIYGGEDLAIPQGLVRPEGDFPISLFGSVLLPEGVALVGEGVELPAALAGLGFPDIVFPDPTFESGMPASIFNEGGVVTIESNGVSDPLTTVVAGLYLESFSGSTIRRQGTFGDTSFDRLGTVRIDQVELSAGCGAGCGGSGIELWNTQNLLVKNTVVQRADDAGWHLSSVGTTTISDATGTNLGPSRIVFAPIGLMIGGEQGLGVNQGRALVAPAGVPVSMNMIFTGDAFWNEFSTPVDGISAGVFVSGYTGNVTFNNDVVVDAADMFAIVVAEASGAVAFNGSVEVGQAMLGSPTLCDGVFCYAILGFQSNGLSVNGGGFVNSNAGGLAMFESLALNVTGVAFDIGATSSNFEGIAAFNVQDVQATGNTVDGSFVDAILISTGSQGLGCEIQGCKVAGLVTAQGTGGGGIKWTSARLFENEAIEGASILRSGIYAEQGSGGVICIESVDNTMDGGEFVGIAYDNLALRGSGLPFEVVGQPDSNLTDDILDNVSAQNNNAESLAASEADLSFVSQCSNGSGVTLRIEPDPPGDIYNCGEDLPLQAVVVFPGGGTADVTFGAEWGLLPNGTGATLDFNVFNPGDNTPPGTATVQASYSDGVVMLSDELDIVIQQECGGIE